MRVPRCDGKGKMLRMYKGALNHDNRKCQDIRCKGVMSGIQHHGQYRYLDRHGCRESLGLASVNLGMYRVLRLCANCVKVRM